MAAYILVGNETDPRIQLINRAIALDTNMVFGYPRTPNQRSLALVAGFCVDFHLISEFGFSSR